MSSKADRRTAARADRVGRLLDLYGGAGETALPLARLGWDVTLVEQDARAVRRAEERVGAERRSLRCVVSRVEDVIERLLPADVVIVNPPRTGLSREVAVRLCACPPLRLVYASCDPATLARDLRRLGVIGERLSLVRAYDMFPQTSHVETLVVADLATRSGTPFSPSPLSTPPPASARS